jgi:hypothetical protein
MKGDRRAKVAAGVTVVGLAALGGAALGSNHGLTAPVASVANGRAPIVTGASGSTAAVQGTVATGAEGHRTPIVTRASTTGGGASVSDD